MSAPRRATRSSASPARSLLLPVVVLLVAAGLAFAAFAGGGGPAPAPEPDPDADADADAGADADPSRDGAEPAAEPSSEDVDQPEAMLADLERREDGDPLAIGDVDAPVLMIEWADFQCPFCGRFARETKPELIDRYVEEGLLRIEWRDLPVLGPESQTAALAGRAAADQDAFWELHDTIYAEDRGSGELDRGRLVAMAAELGLDTDRFETALDDPAHEAAVRADLDIGRSLGITGTPAFLINGRPIVGGQPTEVFVAAIDQLLEERDVP